MRLVLSWVVVTALAASLLHGASMAFASGGQPIPAASAATTGNAHAAMDHGTHDQSPAHTSKSAAMIHCPHADLVAVFALTAGRTVADAGLRLAPSRQSRLAATEWPPLDPPPRKLS